MEYWEFWGLDLRTLLQLKNAAFEIHSLTIKQYLKLRNYGDLDICFNSIKVIHEVNEQIGYCTKRYGYKIGRDGVGA